MDTIIVPHISQKEIFFLYIFSKKFAILCKINGKYVDKFPADQEKPCAEADLDKERPGWLQNTILNVRKSA